MPLTEVGLDPGDIVLDGDPAPPKRGHSSQFSVHFYCGQTAGCIKIPLGTEVGLGSSDIVLDSDPVPPPLKGHNPPCQFLAHVRYGQTAGWMPLGMEVSLVPGDFVLDGDPAAPQTGHSRHPIFGPCLLWPNG